MTSNRDTLEPIPAQRRSTILKLVQQRTSVSVNELARVVGVSLSTVRRDLDELSRLGLIERSHGGAILPSVLGTAFEPSREISAHIARQEKRSIARLAADLLRDGQSVIFDSSSTVMEVAQRVVERDLRLTAVTNDIKIAEVLSRSARVEVVVLGGTLRPGSPTLIGEPGLGFLQALHVDVSLIGIHAIKGTKLCETRTDLAHLKLRMIEAAEYSVLVADSAKFGATAFRQVCDVTRMNEVITDAGLPESTRRELAELRVRLQIASGPATGSS